MRALYVGLKSDKNPFVAGRDIPANMRPSVCIWFKNDKEKELMMKRIDYVGTPFKINLLEEETNCAYIKLGSKKDFREFSALWADSSRRFGRCCV